MRALIVDDNPSDRMIVQAFLRDLKIESKLFENGYEFLHAADEEKFDFVVIDLQMPHVGGLKTIQTLRRVKKYQSIPIIVMSSRSDIHDVQVALKTGANDYMVKPVDRMILEQKLSALKLLDNHHGWTSYDLPSDMRKQFATIQKPLSVLRINEVSIFAEDPTGDLKVGAELQLNLEVLSSVGGRPVLFGVKEKTKEGDKWVVELEFKSITEKERETIRKFCLDIHRSNSEFRAKEVAG